MFKVNLLSDSAQVSLDVIEAPAKSNSSSSSSFPKFAIATILLLAIIGGGAYYYTLPKEMKGVEAPQVASKDKNLKKPTPSPKNVEPVAAAAIEETVKEVPVVSQKAPKAKGPGYPSENLYGQRLAINKMIKNILKVSGENIGYSSVVLQAPNYYYMHGLSPSQKEYKKFKSSLKKASSNQKVTKAENRGITGKSKEFTMYGTFDLKSSPMKKNSNLNFGKGQAKTLESIKAMAKKSGLKIKKVVDHAKSKTDGFTRGVVRFQFESTYKELFPFVKSLKDSKLAVGILQLSLKSTKEEKMAGVFDLVMYSK